MTRAKVAFTHGLDRFVVNPIIRTGIRLGLMTNLSADPRVRVRIPRGPWRTGRAEVREDVDGLAKRRELNRKNGLFGRIDGLIFRVCTTDPIAVRVQLD